MKVGVIHYNLESLAGEEQVALHSVKAFKDRGHEVIFSAATYPDLQLINERLNIDISKSVDHFLFTRGNIQFMPFLSIYQRLLYSSFSIRKLFSEIKPDCVLITSGLCVIPDEFIGRTVMYVHYPYDHELYGGKYRSYLWRVYSAPARFIYENLYPQKEAILLTNTIFTKKLIKKVWGRDALVMYPPVPQYTFGLENNRRNAIVGLGRISREKRYEILLRIAESMPHIQFHIIGSCIPYNLAYLEDLKRSASENVKFHINANHKEKEEVLRSAKVMLHSMYQEHFGIAIPEAMSAGLIPVVHNSGGAKEDSLVDPEFRFEGDIENVEDARNKVQEAIRRWNIGEANRQREKAKEFSPERFRAQIAEFVGSRFRR